MENKIMDTTIVVTTLNSSLTYDHIDHYSDDGDFLTITCKHDFPVSTNTYITKMNLRNVVGYTIIVSEPKEETNNG